MEKILAEMNNIEGIVIIWPSYFLSNVMNNHGTLRGFSLLFFINFR